MAKRVSSRAEIVTGQGSAAAAPKRARQRPAPEAPKVARGKPNAADALVDCPPSHEEIPRLAHSYWEARGCQGGSPEEDWYRAEEELRARRAAAPAARSRKKR